MTTLTQQQTCSQGFNAREHLAETTFTDTLSLFFPLLHSTAAYSKLIASHHQLICTQYLYEYIS